MATARFKDVVAAAGRPQVHALWLAPGQDPALKRAVRECRVMTVHQELRGTKKDYGTVGLHLEGSTQVLIFPKSLRRFGDRHIVGIDYHLILQPEAKDPAPAMKPLAVKRPPAPAPAPEPQPKTGKQRTQAEPALRPAPKRESSGQAEAVPTDREPRSREEMLAEIRRALRELKAGKDVAAYERLQAVSEAG
jgi:hypothetical protein